MYGMPSVTACAQISIMNFIKSPKSGPAKTGPAGPAPTPMSYVCNVCKVV